LAQNGAVRRALLAAVLAATLLTPAAQAAELGVNVNGGAAGGSGDAFEAMSDTKARWARHFVFWDDVDSQGLGAYQAIAAEEGRRGVKTLFTVMSKEGKPPSDPQAYADFMGRLAALTAGSVEAFQVWNEADEPLFWNTGPNIDQYVDLLRRSHAAIKQSAPGALVVFSPTVGNNFAWVEAAYNAGAQGYFDVMAVHTDTACLDRGPTSYYREPDGRIGRFAFLGYREVRKVMEARGDGAKPIWMTEFGWSAAQHVCEFGAGAGQRPAGVTEDQQAQFLLEAMHCLQADPYVAVAMWFTNRDLSDDGKMANMYGLQRHDGARRPAYEAFKSFATNGDLLTGPCGDFEGPAVTLLEPQPGYGLGLNQNLLIRARSDAPDLNRLWFAVEGPGAQPIFADGPISLPRPGDAGPIGGREWGGARDLQVGTHKLTVWATDQNDNPGPPVVLELVKSTTGAGTGPGTGTGTGGPGGGPGLDGRAVFPRLKLGGRGRRRTLSGQALPGITGGAVRAEWQHKRGRRWKRIHARTKPARRPFKFKQRLKFAGRWRVRLVFLGKGTVKRTKSCWIVFDTRSARSRLSCPRGTVRPR
jgi:hypothetical protein